MAQKKREKFKAAEAEAKEMQKFNMFKQVSQSVAAQSVSWVGENLDRTRRQMKYRVSLQAYPSRCPLGCVYFFLLTVRPHYEQNKTTQPR